MQNENGVPTAHGAVVIQNAKPVRLEGIVVRQPRPSWITFELPAEETWRDALANLTAAQRERIESTSFYELLQRQFGHRFLRSLPIPSG